MTGGPVLLVPLGGLGEIGLNALAVVAEDGAILIDCGLLFPQGEHPGIDYLIPDLGFLRQQRDRLRAIFVTHGHEDHVGALPHVLADFPVPVYGTPMTLGFAEARLRQLQPSARKLLRPVSNGESVEVRSLRVEFLPVTHSFVGASALAVTTPAGTLLHTGDFKFDETPGDGKVTDEKSLRTWGDRGVDLLCCDSTAGSAPGRTPSERTVARALRALLPTVEGRAYVVAFPSNIHRVRAVIEASREAGRSVALLGRSMVTAVRVARRLGELEPAPGDLIPEPRARHWPRERLTVLLSGSQGEPGGAFWRVVRGREVHHRILPGDHVLFSSRRIPGNEVAIHGLLNSCLRQGARVHYEESSLLHVSGHASAEDVARMLELTRPRHLLPVHGELRHLDGLARLAVGRGFPPERVFRVENGQSLVMEERAVKFGPRVETGRLFVDSGNLGSVPGPLLQDRQLLGEEGVAIAVGAAGASLRSLRVTLRGIFPEAFREERSREAEEAVREHLRRLPAGAVRDAHALEAQMALALRRHFRRMGGQRPLVLAFAVEVDSAPSPPLE